MRGLSRLLLIYSILFGFFIDVAASKTHTIYWNASNPLFKNGDYEIYIRLGDQIKFYCPHMRDVEDEDGAYLVINKDSEMAHMNCVLESPHQVIACNRPGAPIPVVSSTTARKYRHTALGIQLQPGMTHYFLSTSSGTKDVDGMYKKMGGMCKHDHMRMKIVVDEIDPSSVIESTRSHSTSTVPPSTTISSHSDSINGNEEAKKDTHEHRRHTHKEPILGKYSESDIPALYNYKRESEESPDQPPISPWDSVKMNADELGGDLRTYSRFPDYIISEHSSSAAFSFTFLSIIVLLSLR